MSVPSDPAQRHRQFAAEFAGVADRVSDWSAPTPVDGWTAADVPAHLIEWLPGLLRMAAGVSLPSPADPRADPPAAWRAHAAAVQAVLDDAEQSARPVNDPRFSHFDVGGMIDSLYTPDVFMHRWDLARSQGLDPVQDPGFCTELLTGMSAMEDVLRESGQFGTRVDVADEASPAERLAAFVGRDPDWAPPS